MALAKRHLRSMKLIFKQLAERPNPALAEHVRGQLAKLEERIAIESAHIALLRNPSHPPFRVTAHLEVPGPDLRADESGYTPVAALDRAFSSLAEQARIRKLKRPDRIEGRGRRLNGPARTVTGRRP